MFKKIASIAMLSLCFTGVYSNDQNRKLSQDLSSIQNAVSQYIPKAQSIGQMSSPQVQQITQEATTYQPQLQALGPKVASYIPQASAQIPGSAQYLGPLSDALQGKPVTISMGDGKQITMSGSGVTTKGFSDSDAQQIATFLEGKVPSSDLQGPVRAYFDNFGARLQQYYQTASAAVQQNIRNFIPPSTIAQIPSMSFLAIAPSVSTVQDTKKSSSSYVTLSSSALAFMCLMAFLMF